MNTKRKEGYYWVLKEKNYYSDLLGYEIAQWIPSERGYKYGWKILGIEDHYIDDDCFAEIIEEPIQPPVK